MKKIIRLTETDLRNIIRQVINEALDEHGMGLVGAYQAAQTNLELRMKGGQKDRLVRPNGRVESNTDRIQKAKLRIKEMIREEFIKTFGEDGANADCMCFYHENHVYNFTFHLKGIEQISTRDFSIIGDIVDIDDATLPISLKNAIVPQKTDNVVLVYNIAKRTISLSRPKRGLVIYPYDKESDVWRKLLSLVGKFITGMMSVSR